MPEQEVLDRLGREFHPQALLDLDSPLRQYAQAANLSHQRQTLAEGGPDSLTRARHLIEFEQQFDRMLGYPAQLRPVFEAIVAPLADKATMTLRYWLADALTAADAYQEVLAERMDTVVGQFDAVLQIAQTSRDHDTRIQYAAAHMTGIATFGAAPVEDDLPGLLAERTGLPRERLAALLAALATRWAASRTCARSPIPTSCAGDRSSRCPTGGTCERGRSTSFTRRSTGPPTYYTHPDGAGRPPARPSTGVPAEILDALDEVIRDRPEQWRDLALATLAVRPKDWRAVRKALAQGSGSQSAGSAKRRDRQRARRITAGIQVSPELTIQISQSPPNGSETGPHVLFVRPHTGTTSG